MVNKFVRSFAVVPLVALAACGGGSGKAEGTFEVRIYGEEYIEDSIPAETFSDGWSIIFSSFLISVGDVNVRAGEEGEPIVDDATQRVFDLSQPSDGSGFLVNTQMVPGDDYDHTGFRVAPAAAGVALGNASQADADMMSSGGYSLYVAGTATKGADTITFAWPFTNATRYGECHGTFGAVDGNTGKAQITIHGDHLFYDDLFSSTPNVSFDLVAQADTGGDDDVSPEELAALDITTQERYQVGSTEIDNLWDFIEHQTGTLGHIDGEGHCGEAVAE